jgi:hypothetical protein
MGSGATADILPEPDGPRNRLVGADALAEGLMLVRASTIKVVRLQLAMERRDRQSALQAVDDLVMLDGKIRDFLNEIPASANDLGSMQQEIDEQRRCLAREKFTLGAGTSRFRAAAGESRWIEPEPIRAEPAAPRILRAHQAEQPADRPAGETEDETMPGQPASRLSWAGILLAIAIIAALAGFVFGTGGWEAMAASISRALGGS